VQGKKPICYRGGTKSLRDLVRSGKSQYKRCEGDAMPDKNMNEIEKVLSCLGESYMTSWDTNKVRRKLRRLVRLAYQEGESVSYRPVLACEKNFKERFGFKP
jgi:hypothetical protein